jgi:ribonuclease P protein component
VLKAAPDLLPKKIYGFSRQNRLVNKSDFQSVFDSSCKTVHKYLLARHRSNQFDCPRLGLMISKHHIKNSVNRNRIRRIVRESFRHNQKMIAGLDLIVMVRNGQFSLDKAVLRNDVDQLWQAIAKSKTV